MSLATLYRICLNRIFSFLKEGIWKSCIENPFSELPTRAVDDLMELTEPNDEVPPKISDFILLLTSGRLTRLDLCPFNLEAEGELMIRTLQSISSNSSLNIDSDIKKSAFIYLVRKIISWNPHLEELHLDIQPGFDIIQKCQNLRILRFYLSECDFGHCFSIDLFHRSRQIYYVNSVPVNLSLLSSLKNLEILHMPHMGTDEIANVLEICPKLISIGLNDSLDSLEEIAQERLKDSLLNGTVGAHFELRRCFWGKDSWVKDPHERSAYESKFREKIRSAVNLCPLIQELILYVHTGEAMKELRFLKHLTLLKINFYECEDDYMPDFVSLLPEIGQQLRHLSVLSDRRVPVDVICERCPHLQSLEILGSTFVKNASEASNNLSIKRLTLCALYEEEDKESLLFLLCNCKYLEELFLFAVVVFDDALLNQIFERNPLFELKVTCIKYCSLSKKGYQMFQEKVASIETLVIVSDEANYFYDANRLFKDPNIRYLRDDFSYVSSKEFFNIRLNKMRF